MKEIMYENTTLTLRDVFVSYCKHNCISINQACTTLNIPWTTLAAWVRGERGLRYKNVVKIKDFLQGKYIIDTNVIVSWLEADKDAHLTDSENVL